MDCFVIIAGQSYPGTFIGEHPGNIYEVQMIGRNGYDFVVESIPRGQIGKICIHRTGAEYTFTHLVGRTPATFTVMLQR